MALTSIIKDESNNTFYSIKDDGIDSTYYWSKDLSNAFPFAGPMMASAEIDQQDIPETAKVYTYNQAKANYISEEGKSAI